MNGLGLVCGNLPSASVPLLKILELDHVTCCSEFAHASSGARDMEAIVISRFAPQVTAQVEQCGHLSRTGHNAAPVFGNARIFFLPVMENVPSSLIVPAT
jgi:hypothetical protein